MHENVEDDFKTLVDMCKSRTRQMDEFISKDLCDHMSSSWIVIMKRSDGIDLKILWSSQSTVDQVEMLSRRWICPWSVFIG